MGNALAVVLDDYIWESLEDASASGGASPGVLLRRAMRYYLADGESGRPGWPCSEAYEDDGGDWTVELDVDLALWGAFSRESERQGVSTDRLARHAALYYLADRDSGQLTRKILDGLEDLEP